MTPIAGFRTLLLRLAGIAAILTAITFAGFRVFAFNSSTAGFIYLLALLFISRFWGFLESMVASVAAVLCFNFFFLPPVLQFTIADSRNWVAFFTFLATTALVSTLSDHARRQTLAAEDRRREMERLYELSRAVLLIQSNSEMAAQAAEHAAGIFSLSGISLYDRVGGQIHRAGTVNMPEWDDRLREVAIQGTVFRDEESGTLITAVRLGGEPIGSIAIRGASLSDSALSALVNLIAIVLERARTIDAANRSDLARQSQELKSTLLDAIAHGFKTPLTSIRAAASALHGSRPVSPEAQRELAAIVDEESERLGRLVTEAIQMARVEAGRIVLRKQPVAPADLAQSAGAFAAGRSMTYEIAPNLPAIEVDRELLELALLQIVDNAVKYSAPGSALTVRAFEREGRVLLCIRNQGRGIPESEQVRIFDKFYRMRGENNRVPGTGMGLSIARDIVHAHGAQIWVESGPDAGAEFCFSFVSAHREALV